MPTLKELAKPLRIAKAIKRPGRLTNAAKRHGRTVQQEAQADKGKPKNTIGDAARFYLNVLKPITARAKKK